MPLSGSLLHYRIVQPIGKGGMGEVYLAEDTKLQRQVALKVLPEIFALDPDRRQRFAREAQAVAALNHPNIVTIYSVEEATGVPFLTMELVEGKPLNELIPSGGMPLPSLLKIGTAIADALSAAQQRGITHRDLKPANVMMTADGRVKVLDFGLARLQEAQVASAGEDVTRLTSRELTGEGKIIGTVAYMSPEQAEGKPVDPRSDIFSLGVLLHEMATGDRPFKGDTNVSIISSILKDTPSSITDLNPKLPTDLARIVRRCLAKDPSKRFQTATDVRAELEDLATEISSGSGISSKQAVRRRPPRFWMAVDVAVVLVIVALGAWYMRGRGRATPAAEQGFTIDRLARLTTSGTVSMAALSRDGRYVVHVKDADGDPSLWVRQTVTTSDVRIVPPAPVVYDGLVFSPDGNYVYYNTYRKPGGGIATLYRVPVLGGAPTPVVEDVDSPPAFAPDGSRFAFMRGVVEKGTTALVVCNIDGTNARVVAALEKPNKFQPEGASWSPDGKTILASASGATGAVQVYAVDVASGQTVPVGERWGFVRNVQWMPDGRSFLADAVDLKGATATPQIWRVSYPSGASTRVTNDLNNYRGLSLSADGRTLATVQGEVSAGLTRFERGGREWRPITAPNSNADGLTGVALLPDGRIVYAGGGSGMPQIFVMNADGTGARQITTASMPSTSPSVPLDGRWIYFHRFAKEGVCIFRIASDGSGPEQLTRGGDESSPIISPDGRTVYFTRNRSGQPHAGKVPADGGSPELISDAYFAPFDISVDGTRLVGLTWDATHRRPASGVLKVDGSGGVQILEDVQPAGVRWLPDGGVVYLDRVRRPMEILAKPASGGAPRPFAPPLPDTQFNGAISRDGKVMVVSHGAVMTDVVLITAANPAKPN